MEAWAFALLQRKGRVLSGDPEVPACVECRSQKGRRESTLAQPSRAVLSSRAVRSTAPSSSVGKEHLYLGVFRFQLLLLPWVS